MPWVGADDADPECAVVCSRCNEEEILSERSRVVVFMTIFSGETATAHSAQSQ